MDSPSLLLVGNTSSTGLVAAVPDWPTTTAERAPSAQAWPQGLQRSSQRASERTSLHYWSVSTLTGAQDFQRQVWFQATHLGCWSEVNWFGPHSRGEATAGKTRQEIKTVSTMAQGPLGRLAISNRD